MEHNIGTSTDLRRFVLDIQVLWSSGSVMEFQTTFLASGNGGGYSASQEFLDVSRPAKRGVLLLRRAFTFDKPDPERFCDDGTAEQKVLIEPSKVIDVVRLRVDGETVLARAYLDDDGSLDPSISAPLLNMVLPGCPEVAPGRPLEQPAQPDGGPAPDDIEADQTPSVPDDAPQSPAPAPGDWWVPDDADA